MAPTTIRNANDKLNVVNNIHSSHKFTIERENNMSVQFFDMLIKRTETELSLEWYMKPTDTGLEYGNTGR